MKNRSLLYIFLILLYSVLNFACSDGTPISKTDDLENPDKPKPDPKPDPDPDKGSKETYFPESVWNVDAGNDYQSKNSQFNVHRMAATENLAAFWEPGFGSHPSTTSDAEFRFPLDDLMKEADEMYVFYRDVLKFVEKGKSLTDKYRMLLYFYYSTEGTLYGGGSDNKVGVAWITPGRVKYPPYGGMAHELGHSFQYMVAADGHWGYSTNPAGSKGQVLWEMTSQYMLWQYYPNWIEFENYHLNNFMENTHKAFLHEDNCYSSPFVLEYWSNKYGLDFIGKLWRESQKGEDPVMAYKRMNNMSQDEFNDDIFEAYCRFITWDMDRVREISKKYVNQHTCQLDDIGGNWYRISQARCPQNYGYNAVRMDVPAAGTEVVMSFNGVAGADGYRSVNIEKAGWRYGFVSVKKNGEREYGDIYSGSDGVARYVVPDNCDYLWLVVSGAPAEHWEHIWDDDESNDEQWPYQIKISGTKPHLSNFR